MKKQGGLRGARQKFNSRLRMFAILTLTVIGAISFYINPADVGLMVLATAPIALVAKMRKKAEDNGETLSDEEVKLFESIEAAFTDFAKGVLTEEELATRIEEFKKTIKEELGTQVTEIEETIKAINKEVKEMRDRGIKLGNGSAIEKAVDAILDHQKVKDFLQGNSKKSGKIRLKDIVGIETGWLGRTLLSQQTDRLEQEVADRRVNIRDTMMVDTGDPAYPSITYAQIYELNRNAVAVSENGRLPESAFKVKEITDEVKRIGTYIPISKRLLKSRVYLRSYLINRLPKWVRMSEDFEILFGDGTGEHLNGVAKRALNINAWLTGTVVTGVAASVASVDTYDGGTKTLITFALPFSKIEEGQVITFTGAPAGSVLLNANMLHKVNDRSIVLDVAYTALTTTQIAALAFTVKNNFYNTVAAPDLSDAIKAIFAILTYGEYTPNMIALNPSTVFELETLKDTTGRSLDISVSEGGSKRIAGRAIVETTAVPPGYFFAGDMQNGAALVDYTSLEVEFAEDVESKLTNSVVLIAQEEVILQVFNPFACAYGKLSDVLAAIHA
jgi:HK97 family phage major capsid protein